MIPFFPNIKPNSTILSNISKIHSNKLINSNLKNPIKNIVKNYLNNWIITIAQS